MADIYELLQCCKILKVIICLCFRMQDAEACFILAGRKFMDRGAAVSRSTCVTSSNCGGSSEGTDTLYLKRRSRLAESYNLLIIGSRSSVSHKRLRSNMSVADMGKICDK